MDDSKAENNKAIVLEAFDTLFNKRDYTAAEQLAPGRTQELQNELLAAGIPL